MKSISVLLALALADAAHSAVFTNSASADAFVRTAAPTLNYGGAGALSVSGPNAANGADVTNGVFDSFIRFNTAQMVTSFDSTLGTNNWSISGARLRVTELGAPANTLFNRGIGAFEIRWIANDDWIEGVGNPNAPTNTGIAYGDERTLLNSAVDVSLGTFTNSGADAVLSFALGLPRGFVDDLRAGGEVGLYLTATDSRIGFTIDSRSFQMPSARPVLEISAVTKPGLTTISVAGTDVVLAISNGVPGSLYEIFTSTNIASPLNQWVPIATAVASGNGSVSAIVTNGGRIGLQRFFILQAQPLSN